jgi:hypothetical protein
MSELTQQKAQVAKNILADKYKKIVQKAADREETRFGQFFKRSNVLAMAPVTIKNLSNHVFLPEILPQLKRSEKERLVKFYLSKRMTPERFWQ